MKKALLALLAAAMVLSSFVITTSATTLAPGNYWMVNNPAYRTTTPPTLDGVIDYEWNGATKYAFNSGNCTVVRGTPDFSWNTYLMWDDDYLYMAYEVHNSNGGNTVLGQPMYDYLDMYIDVNTLGWANGCLNMHSCVVRTVPLASSEDNNVITGLGIAYCDSYNTEYACANVNSWKQLDNQKSGTYGAIEGTGTDYVVEQKVAWTDIEAMLKICYPGIEFPEIKEDVLLTMMPSFEDFNSNGQEAVWAIGQSVYVYHDPAHPNADADGDVVIDWPAAIPACYGFAVKLAGFRSTQVIPYASVAPTLDGVLGDDWNNAAKFTMDGSNAMIVSGALASGASWTTYVMYDDDNLYLAYEVTNVNKGVLYLGNSGDILDMYFDINGLGMNNGNPNCGNLMTRTIAVTQSTDGRSTGAKDEITGLGIAHSAAVASVGGWTDLTDASNTTPHGGAAGTQSKYVIEQKISWAEYKAIFEATYAGVTFPNIEKDTVLTFMPSLHDCNENYAETVWCIGQNVGVTAGAAAVPSCYAFRGILGEKPTTKITEANATIGSDITMNFYVDIPEGSEDKYTFKATINGTESTIVPEKKNGEYVIPVTSINPQQMGDTITVNVMEGDESIQEISISVKDYLDRVVEENSELTTLCSDMLAFGSAAQEYLGYKTDSLVNGDAEWYEPTEGINEAAILANTDRNLSGNTEKGIGGAGVILGSYNYVYFNVNADDIAKENVVLTAGEKSVTDYEIVKKSGKLQIVTPALKATDNGTVFTLTVNIGGKESTVSYSVNAYIKAKYNNADTKLVNLIKALYNYGASSDAYASGKIVTPPDPV